MASNHKLTAVIAGRTIAGSANADGKMIINFTDGSTMTIKTAGNSNSASTGGTIKAVRQAETTLDPRFREWRHPRHYYGGSHLQCHST